MRYCLHLKSTNQPTKPKEIEMRVTTVTKARKATRERCLQCGLIIESGQGYRWVKPRYGSRKVLHLTCRTFKGSETVSNDKLSTLYGYIEDAETELAELDCDDAQSFLDGVAENIREVAEMYNDAASAIEDGFGHSTFASEEMTDNAEQLESFASDVEGTDFDEWDEDTVSSEFDDAIAEDDEYALEEFEGNINEQAAYIVKKRDEYITEKRSEWEDEVRSALSDAISASPL